MQVSESLKTLCKVTVESQESAADLINNIQTPDNAAAVV